MNAALAIPRLHHRRGRAALRSALRRLEGRFAAAELGTPAVARLAADPTLVLARAGLEPDPWQRGVLTSEDDRLLLLCSRQAGKSTVAAALALLAALRTPGTLVLVLSPSLRQSGELFRKVIGIFNALGRPAVVRSQTALRLELAGGSRVVALPGTEGTVRGFAGVGLLVIDEAARVADDLYRAVRPMLAVSRGRLVALSTPFGQRGWFHDAWASPEPWARVRITAGECPRIDPAFLAAERRALGDRWFRQEYECDFTECIDAVFSAEDIRAAFSGDATPLFPE